MNEYIERGGKLFPTPFSSEEHGDYRQGWNHCLRAIYQMPAANVVEIPEESREPGMHCACWEPKKETEITSIAIWATKGIELAQKNGIAEETLCTMLKSAWNIQRLFETARKENDNE